MSDRDDDFTTDGAQEPEDGMDEIDRHARIVAQLGGERCAKMYTAYRRGLDHENVQSHIVSCSLCSFMLEDTIRERAANERAKEIASASAAAAAADSRIARRRFIKVAALVLAAGGLVAAGAGVTFLVTRKPPTPNLATELSNLDSLYATGGLPAIASLLNPATGSETDANGALRWIQTRNVVAAYGLLANALADPRTSVKMTAYTRAVRVRLADLKVHQALLDSIANAEGDATHRSLLKRLADDVRRS